MKVKEVMTSEPVSCAPGSSVALAAKLMLEGDCGILPIVEDGKLCGVVTDRDLFIALGTRNKRPTDLTVGAVAGPNIWTCGPEDDVHSALGLMKEHRIRRVPVVGLGGILLGIVSMNDILLTAGPRKAVRNDEVIDVLQAVCAHHQPLVPVGAG